MYLKTNADNLDELDLALAEIRQFVTFQKWEYEGRRMFKVESVPPIALDRMAMFDETVDDLISEVRPFHAPTLWAKMRAHRYDKRMDHSTHSLAPFQGKLRPQIARACINLAMGNRLAGTVADPFMGSGTVLLEANLMGFTPMGSDLDPYAHWLTMTKLETYEEAFEARLRRLEKLAPTPNIRQQRLVCLPNECPGSRIERAPALTFLRGQKNLDSIVTSPPYYDAIDYNARHAHFRQALDLPEPSADTMGIRMTIKQYEDSIVAHARAMAEALSPSGRIVLVAAAYRGIDVPKLFEQALTSYGLKVRYILQHDYRTPVMGVAADIILVMEKP